MHLRGSAMRLQALDEQGRRPARANGPTIAFTNAAGGALLANEPGQRSPLAPPWRPAGSRKGRLVVLA